MAHRTTLLLDEEARTAARELAAVYRCSTSEAIRRAVVRQRDSVYGVPAASRQQRKQALRRMFAVFDGNDAAAEVKRLKGEDGGF